MSTHELTKTYPNGYTAVKDVSLELHPGRFYLIMGRSGAGKTTLLQILGLLDDFSSGQLFVDNVDTKTLNEADKARLRMQKFGFVFQSYYLNEKMKAYENVMLPMYINPEIADKKERAEQLLATVGLTQRADNFPRQLSGGEQQRVALARALANAPSCIFADEPTGNLDTENETKILELLKRISLENNKCVMVVSHNEAVRHYADEVFLMQDGVLSREG
ncbi:MAG: ABC transporter ATP-binding protein [Firmicutes bacterium]|nr:ABC transporter ATP-binding protein [Bacillota bacterium]